METTNTYRHTVDKKTKDFFIEMIKQSVSTFNMQHIGFVGIVGSHKKEYSHDIDIVIFPEKNAKIGQFIASVSNFYEHVEEVLKTKNERMYISISPRKILQEMTYYLSSLQEGAAGLIPIHSLVFTDFKSFQNLNPSSFVDEMKKTLITLHGKFDVIYELKNDIPQEKLEPYFLILDFELHSKLRSFPRHIIRANAESLFSYLNEKYDLKIQSKSIHNVEDIQNILVDVLMNLDSENYK